jgi:hypothetical protein
MKTIKDLNTADETLTSLQPGDVLRVLCVVAGCGRAIYTSRMHENKWLTLTMLCSVHPGSGAGDLPAKFLDTIERGTIEVYQLKSPRA